MPRSGALAALVLLTAALACGRRDEGVAPPQPIAFSHRVHAGTNQIGCLMCHAYAEHSPVAGVPSMARCAGCHKFIDRDKLAVKLVNESYAAGRVIPWRRVHRVPDHVHFIHERHLAAGLWCDRCHGQVQTMDAVRQVSPLTMGWCVDCHRARNAPTDCLTCHK